MLTAGTACGHTLTRIISQEISPEELLDKRTHGIVQAERFVPFSPQLTYASFTLDDEGLDTKILETRGEFEPRLTTTNDNHNRLLIGPIAFSLAMALFRPRSELRFLFPERTGQLRAAMQTLEGREYRVCLPIPIGHWDEAKYPRSGSHRGRECENCLDPRDIRVGPP